MKLTSLLRGLALSALSGLGGAIAALHKSEDDLALVLVQLSDRHPSDHEIHFVARDLAGWSREHVRRLAEAGHAHGLHLDPEPTDPKSMPAVLRRAASDALGRLHAPSLLLLADLGDVHRKAADVSLRWEVLAQSAQAAEDAELTALAADCHPQTLRQMRWTNAQVKELAAQAILPT
jgi:hypothetical protein